MRNRLLNLATLGGMPLPELLRRTALASWHDDVFGQGGRMAFYQFLALFPSLLITFTVITHVPHLAHHLHRSVSDVSAQLVPDQISQILQGTFADFKQRPRLGLRLFSVFAAAVWAAHNGTWAMIWGLNRAYEVEERRSWFRLTVLIILLTIALIFSAALGLLLLFSSAFLQEHTHANPHLFHALEWLSVALCVFVSFAVLYRFAPDLPRHNLRWATPGALCALVLWLASTLAARLYFGHINDYTRSYGPLNRVVILLLWLYATNGALLIGAEMNSEIQKSETGRPGHPAEAPEHN